MASLTPFRLDGRRLLLTGAGGHLGRAIATALCAAGAEVVLAGRSAAALDEQAGGLNRLHGAGRARALPLDIASDDSRRAAARWIETDGAPLHGIINSAYGGRTGGVTSITAEDFAAACAQNLSGPFELVRLLLDTLTASAGTVAGGSAIVNIASMYGSVSPDPRLYTDPNGGNPVHYGATKGGMIQMTRYLACHLAPRGIRVNSLSPGACPNPQVQAAQPDFIERLSAKVPMARIGKPEEIAWPVVFLLSAAAAYVTGIDLPVDGGWTAW